jgi:hypothetical protein
MSAFFDLLSIQGVIPALPPAAVVVTGDWIEQCRDDSLWSTINKDSTSWEEKVIDPIDITRCT